MSTPRTTERPISPIFLDRWSPRSFTDAAISHDELLTILEAARWAPSAFNVQPWRFIYGRAGTPAWASILGLLHPFNQSWAQRAAALVVIASAKTSQAPGAPEPAPNSNHTFDAGTASGYLALQASLLGWHTHAMAGIDKDRTHAVLGVPQDHAVQVAVAIGKRNADCSALSESQRAKEFPSPRLPLSEIAFEGAFGQRAAA